MAVPERYDLRSRVGGRALALGALLLAAVALAAAARATVTVVYLGVVYRDQLDPFSVAASYYVFVDGGEQPFVSAAVALAVGTLALLVGLAAAGLRMAGRPGVLIAVWALCLVLAAIFPTDPEPGVLTLHGWVHQFAGAGILALLSLAGLAAAPRLAEHRDWRPVVGVVRWLSTAAAVLAVLYLLSRLPDLVPAWSGMYGGMETGGLLQRLTLAFDVAVLVTLAVHLLRVSWPAVRYGPGATLPSEQGGPAAS